MTKLTSKRSHLYNVKEKQDRLKNKVISKSQEN